MRQLAHILTFLSLTVALSSQAQTTDLTIGKRHTFESEVLDTARTLNVYLPLSYHTDSANTYPVIYVLDGSLHEDFLHIAGLSQFAAYPWLEWAPECIVVGIENVNRYHDFTSPCDLPEYVEINPDNGGSADFIQFLGEEAIPFMEQHYRCSAQRMIIGQSLGGLVATEILFKNPNLFTDYLIVSPSLWWDEESLLDSEPGQAKNTLSVFVAVGKEGRTMKRVARQLYRKLRSHKNHYSTGFEYFPELDHGDALHKAVYAGFEFLFGRTVLVQK